MILGIYDLTAEERHDLEMIREIRAGKVIMYASGGLVIGSAEAFEKEKDRIRKEAFEKAKAAFIAENE